MGRGGALLKANRLVQARKDVSQIFNNLLRRQIGQRWPTVEYLSQKEETIFAALKGCELFPSLVWKEFTGVLTSFRGQV